MERAELLRILYRWNPWWEGRRPLLPSFKRRIFGQLEKELTKNKITAIIGPRQTGKTTLILQAIDGMLEKGISPREILYLLMDDLSDAFEQKKVTLREIIEVYSEEVLRLPVNETKKFIFFDEIQIYPRWAMELKVIFEQKLPLKIIISGSASTGILKGASESLVGRLNLISLLSLEFKEILECHLKKEYEEHRLEKKTQNLVEAFKDSLGRSRPDTFFKEAKELEKAMIPIEEKIRILLSEYQEKGGYPEVAIQKLDRYEAFSRLRDYVNLVFHKDFVKFFNIRDAKSLERIFKIICKNTSCIMVERNLAKDLAISINTVRNYLGFLEDTFLVGATKIFASSYAKRLRCPEKFYILDIGIGNAIVGYSQYEKGNLMETLVYRHLWELSERERGSLDISYWRKNNKFEVDLVIELRGGILPMEVKSGQAKDVKGLREFLVQYKGWGIIISERLFLKDNIVHLPLPLFLMLG
jgi:predicted AAA+ superfamily ATPase